MAYLSVEQPGMAPNKIELQAQETSLGRALDNDIVLVDQEVSGHHAKLVCRGTQVIMIDLNSLNGTYVNRQRIVERLLNSNDEIYFGPRCRAVFQMDGGINAAPSALDDSGILQDLNNIREEMDRVSNSMTMFGKVGAAKDATPLPYKKGADGAPGEEDLLKMSRAFRRLDALYKASKIIASEFDLDKRLSSVLDTAMEVTDAERGFLIMRDPKTDELSVKTARGMGTELHANSPSMGIAGKSAYDGEPVLMTDAGSDAQFGMRESVIMQRIRSAMCVPLQVDERIFGSIYVDTSKPGCTFHEEDLELFAAMAAQSAMALENMRLYDQMVESEKKRANLGRFLSPNIVEMVMAHGTDIELGGAKSVVTTLFCDIRGFTPMSETMPPSKLVELLNEHFTAMTQIVFDYRGTLDKYNGDEVMALFGTPICEGNDAELAIHAALAMQDKNKELNELRVSRGQAAFEVGVGVNTGEVVAGYIGSPDRMDFTVIGDHVNTASRFCSLAKPGEVITGVETFELVKDSVVAEDLGLQALKGKGEKVQCYRIVSSKGNFRP